MSARKPARCLVIGGAGHLGAAICRRLAADDAQIVLTYHSGPERAQALAASLPGALALPCDLERNDRIAACVDAALAHLGGLDALITCAGHPGGRAAENPGGDALLDVTEASWEACFAVNVRGPFFAVQRAAAALRAARGQVLLVGSVDGVKPVPMPIDYGASKAALDGLSRSLSKALGPAGVRVNAIHPGVLTGGLSHALRPGLREDFVKHGSLKREGRPEEVAAMIAFMVRENSYVTGQGLVIDGGL